MKNDTSSTIITSDQNEHGMSYRTPIMNPNDPNIVSCPFGCGQLTWWNANECWNCRRPVFEYFLSQKRKERKRKLEKHSILTAVIGFALFVVGFMYLLNVIIGTIGILMLLVAGNLARSADKQ